MNDFNAGIIREFHENAGVVGGPFEGDTLLLLTTTGAKSGAERTTPLVYLGDGDRLLIFASKAGAPEHPAWFHNLRANSTVTVEVGDGSAIERFQAHATVVEGAERDRLYAKQAQAKPQFAEYERKTDRTIPVVALERA